MEESLSGDVLQQQDRDALITLLKYNDVKTEDLPYQLVLFYFENASLLQGLLFADCMGADLRQVYASFMGQTKNSMGLKKALVAMYDGDGGDDSTSFVSLTLHNYREHLSCVYNTLQQSILKSARFHRQLPSDVLERHAALVALCQQKEFKQKRCKNCKGKIHQSGQWHSLLKQQLVLVQGLRFMIMEIWRASRKSWGKDSVTVLRQGGAVVRKAADPTRVASWGVVGKGNTIQHHHHRTRPPDIVTTHALLQPRSVSYNGLDYQAQFQPVPLHLEPYQETHLANVDLPTPDRCCFVQHRRRSRTKVSFGAGYPETRRILCTKRRRNVYPTNLPGV